MGPGSQSIVNMFPRPTPTSTTIHNHSTLQPRRQVPEEDECPICGNELPATGPNNDDSPRTQHIEECIALHSASPATPAPTQQLQTSASLPTQRTRGMSNAGEGASQQQQRLAHAARGMFPFTATEKDCVDADGAEEECVICFEEYGAGDRLARLVCWCKFHEVRLEALLLCSRRYWDSEDLGRGIRSWSRLCRCGCERV